jgi:hypothetical protein
LLSKTSSTKHKRGILGTKRAESIHSSKISKEKAIKLLHSRPSKSGENSTGQDCNSCTCSNTPNRIDELFKKYFPMTKQSSGLFGLPQGKNKNNNSPRKEKGSKSKSNAKLHPESRPITATRPCPSPNKADIDKQIEEDRFTFDDDLDEIEVGLTNRTSPSPGSGEGGK